jgi:chromate transporter
VRPTSGQLAVYFLGLGTWGFGGPVALVGYMQRDLVERRGWFTREEYLEGLALAQLSPGPLAAQVAIYLGWLRGGVPGATLAGVAFVLPSFLMVLALAALYVRHSGTWLERAFYGVGAAVIAVIARSAWKLARLTVRGDGLLWGSFAVAALATAITESESGALILACGLVTMIVRRARTHRIPPPAMAAALGPVLLTAGPGAANADLLWRIGWYFAEAGAFVFGSGLAIVPFLYGGVVQEFRWLDDRQFLDAVAVAMITPGPVVITVAFIGYLTAGLAGALVAAAATFLPCYLLTVLPAPYYRRLSRHPEIRSFIDGVTAAASGAIAGAVVVLGRRAVVDVTTALIAAAVLVSLLAAKRVPEPLLMLAAAAAGLLLR